MAAALYYGEPIAIHMFRQDVEVAKVPFNSNLPITCPHDMNLLHFPRALLDVIVFRLDIGSDRQPHYCSVAVGCGLHKRNDPRTLALHLELCDNEGTGTHQ